MEFIGRQRELALLSDELRAVERSGTGRFVLVRGRRRVGKSRLIEEFVRRAGRPHVFFTATAGRVAAAELRAFTAAVAASDLRLPTAGDVAPTTWDAALAMTTATAVRPYVLILDEFPFLVRGSSEVEGAVQNVWDRVLSRLPVLLVLVGSDFAVMEALTSYERPLYGRPTRVLRVDPLNPAEVAELLGAPAIEALDDYLVVGGFPELVRSRADARRLEQYLAEQLNDPTSPLLVAGERSLSAQFPPETPARHVLRAIGSDASAFGRISDRSGVPRPTLQRTLDLLVGARVVARETPLAAPPGRHRRYRIADPALRFWLRYLDRGLADVERERGDLVLARIQRDWTDYRGRAIEPIVRHALTRLLPDERLADVAAIGSWWTRTHDVEVDVVGVDDADTPRRVTALGTIRWRDRRPLTRGDLAELHDRRGRVPGTDDATRLIGVGQTDETAAGFDAVVSADDLLDAYRR
jgi:hypothetical protein